MCLKPGLGISLLEFFNKLHIRVGLQWDKLQTFVGSFEVSHTHGGVLFEPYSNERITRDWFPKGWNFVIFNICSTFEKLLRVFEPQIDGTISMNWKLIEQSLWILLVYKLLRKIICVSQLGLVRMSNKIFSDQFWRFKVSDMYTLVDS